MVALIMSSELSVLSLFSASSISTNYIEFHPITYRSTEDAALINNLRNRKKNNFLKASENTVESQLAYLEQYQTRFLNGEEIYYKIFDKAKKIFNGVVRITELNKTKIFNWESLVFSPDCSPVAPIDTMLAIYRIGFEGLNREKCGPWEVNKSHANMMKIHQHIGMYNIEREDKQYFYVSVLKEDFYKRKDQFKQFGSVTFNK